MNNKEDIKITITIIISLLLIAIALIWISTIPEGTNGILTATKTDATETDATETDSKVTYIERYNLEPMTWNEVEEDKVYIPSPVLSERKEPKIEVEVVTTETITEETTEVVAEEVYYEEPVEESIEEPVQEPTGMSYLGTYYITGYVATGNPCSNGNYPTAGYTVASNTIPMGTTIWIDGLGTRVVEDTGGMAGNVIDVFVGSVDEAYAITGNYEVYIYE